MTRSGYALVAYTAVVATVGGFYLRARLAAEWGESGPDASAFVAEPSQHLVTRRMAEASRAQADRVAPAFDAPATDGRRHRLERPGRGPVLLTFIKDGCPCSESAQPFFNRLRAAYPEAEVLGVVDVGADRAAIWAARFRVDYPLLLDPGLEIVRAYAVENSAYTVLIDGEGRIRRQWPGYSVGMLRELGATLAGLLGTAERPFDCAAAPDEEYTGCPYEL